MRSSGLVPGHADYWGGKFVNRPLRGYALEDSVEIYGDEIEHTVEWRKGSDLGHLSGRPVRLRFVMKDADLYSIRFGTTPV